MIQGTIPYFCFQNNEHHMASGFFAILDDIGALMDDVALASKLATQKTTGILGDDLAVNAEKATGFLSSRELPVLWAITKGSLINKLILVPIALLLNAFFPSAINIALIIGGLYLAYEGMEKVIAFLFHHAEEEKVTEEKIEDTVNTEKSKIKSAIMTDFILSMEIVIIALSTVLTASLAVQILTVSFVAILATVGVYGIVALIVRMDDAGFRLIKKTNDKGRIASLGHLLVKMLPVIIRILEVVGTIALILVSGGIFAHYIDFLHHFLEHIPMIVKELILGVTVGLIVFGLVAVGKKLISVIKRSNKPDPPLTAES